VRRHYWNPVLTGECGDRRGSHLETASRRSVRLAEDEEVIGLIGHASQQRNAEGTRAEKRNPPDARH